MARTSIFQCGDFHKNHQIIFNTISCHTTFKLLNFSKFFGGCFAKFMLAKISRSTVYIRNKNIPTTLQCSYTNTTEQTVQTAMRAGTNLDCGQFYQRYAQVYVHRTSLLPSVFSPLSLSFSAPLCMHTIHLLHWLNYSTISLPTPLMSQHTLILILPMIMSSQLYSSHINSAHACTHMCIVGTVMLHSSECKH